MHAPMPVTTFPSPPRRVFRKAGSGCALAFPRLFILPHMIAGIVMTCLVPARLYTYYCGTSVKATIHHVERRTSRKSGEYWVAGWHYVLNGQRHDEEYETLNNAEGPRAKIGDTIDGRAAMILGYPMFIRSNEDMKDDAIRLGLFSLAWNGFLSLFVYILWVVPIRQRRLARYGEPAPGVIVSRQERRGRGTTYSVTYKFMTSDGQEIVGKSDVPKDGYDVARYGTPVTVLYNPRKPKRSLPYEMSDFIVE